MTHAVWRDARGFLWAAAGVGAATGCFWLGRGYLDKGQASLLYLPVVLACAVRFGFGPAVVGSGLSFVCWNFFFLPPFHTLVVADPRDWLSLLVFLVAAMTTAQLAAQTREQTRQAQAREAEIVTLFQASETISREVRADRLLATLTTQLQTLCHATHCLVMRAVDAQLASDAEVPPPVRQLAEAAFAHDQAIGFGDSRHLWARALPETDTIQGVYLPLHAASARVGVLHVGPRDDGRSYSALEERLILTLANHAAVVIARDLLAADAAQAAALREADALKESLLSLVSHELRTPLASIKASASGLLQPGSDWGEDARREALRAIDTEADRLGGLVSNLLDLSRLEGGAWRPRKDWCDVLEVVGTALDRLPPAEAARVSVDAPVDLPLLQADYTQIALVLTNLLENAVKYGNAACLIMVSISTVNDEMPGILVRVRDFGAGLMVGEETRLFERFYRSPRHQKSSIRGTGLGLALCLAVMQAHGGRLWAANAPAGEPSGAIFSFFLPRGDTP